jgi:hypothetical protein
MKRTIQLIPFFLLAALAASPSAKAATKPVRVFILAGQSNMEGHGIIAADPKRNGGKGSLEFLVKDGATAKHFAPLVDAAGQWRKRDDVWITYFDRKGPLTVGYGARQGMIGPELGFGWVMGDAIDEPVLLVKCAWGGKSLAVDFRPPSAGKPPYSLGAKADAAIAQDPAIIGKYYRETLALTKAALANIKDLVPGSDGSYVLSGFGWHQGWNDRINDKFNAEYESNMAHFIRDIRKDLGAPGLPFVIAETGMNGPEEKHPRALSLMKAQAAVAERAEFKGNVAFVGTKTFWRPQEQSPSGQGYHWNSNAEAHYLIGEAMGEAMKRLVKVRVTNQVQEGEMAGYLLVPNEKVPETYNAGFSMYVAAWPLLQEYPGSRFQTGLFGTWMFAQYDGPKPLEKMYSDIEGGLGWWRDTRFATETPKFIMGGVALNFIEWANGPGAGKGRSWDQPKGKYGVAQLSPWLLWPPDGLNLKQGTCGELFGYGYLPLPLTPAKPTTAGKSVPTGDQCWTLFLNTRNFKGPVAFFTPYFWSGPTVNEPRLAGMFLDTRPSQPNRALQMETQHVPAVLSVDAKGETYARIARTFFPRGPGGDSVAVHRITSYSRKALWDGVKAWFEGGAPASGAIDPTGARMHIFPGRGGATWRIYAPNVPAEKRAPLAWSSFATPMALDANTFGYRWNYQLAAKSDSKDGSLVTLPEYYHLVTDKNQKTQWVAVRAEDVPAETGLVQFRFRRPREDRPEPYVTPDAPESCWKKPGPVAGPFKTLLGDGSTVTYYWYRFADQPAMLNADLTDEERESLQTRVEKLHRNWRKDRDYLPPPTIGELANLDPALIVTPPPGLEAGYVPIATRQGVEE